MYEEGEREAAAAAAREAVIGLHQDLVDLPAAWVKEYLCLLHLLESIAAEPATSALEQVVDQVQGSPWPGYAACAVDELTGLANRHVYTRQLKRLRSRRSRVLIAVLLLDIDHFKAVNDTFGHSVGDEVLRRCANECAQQSRTTDLVARLGGDEFVVVRDTLDPLDVRQRAERLVRQVGAHPWSHIHPDLRVTVSAGMAIGLSADIDELLQGADAALYRAKADGRARLVSESDADGRSYRPGDVAGGVQQPVRAR